MIIRIPVATLAVVLFSTALAWAGPIADFDRDFDAAYADYRAALFQTNKNDRSATLAAVAALTSKWTALRDRYGANPPPHLAEATDWPGTMAGVAAVVEKAAAEAHADRLPAAHETLEAVRDIVGRLRERAGVIRFSDRMNDYHTAMEEVIGHTDVSTAEGRSILTERIGVLAFLAERMKSLAPAATAANPEFQRGIAAVTASVARLRSAARAGDDAAIKAAVDGLKGPYSKLFLDFG